MTERLHERAQRIRERLLVRAWEYRQRNYAKGVWHRLRRLLVDAAEVWIIDDIGAARLESAGHVPNPVGLELVPGKRVFLVDGIELNDIPGRRRIPVRMSADLLQARNLVLVPLSRTRRS